MKVHPQVKDQANAKKLARAVGLNKIKAKPIYSLYTTGIKNESTGYSYPIYAGEGNVFIIAQDSFVWIAVIGPNTWFKTSPVLKCEAFSNLEMNYRGFKIETDNSYYELRLQ